MGACNNPCYLPLYYPHKHLLHHSLPHFPCHPHHSLQHSYPNHQLHQYNHLQQDPQIGSNQPPQPPPTTISTTAASIFAPVTFPKWSPSKKKRSIKKSVRLTIPKGRPPSLDIFPSGDI